MFKKIIKAILIIILILGLIVGGYFVYAYAAYYRLDDNITSEIYDVNSKKLISSDETHRITTANIGFGAYSDDYTFFFDDGKESWAFSKDAVFKNIDGEIEYINSLDSEFILLQEVDIDATRSYHVNELERILSNIEKAGKDQYSYVFTQNFDSVFLFWPLYQPHGKSLAGLVTISDYSINESIRRSLPIETGFSKFFDLDRCYSKNRIDVDNGKQLVIYNVHLSAYTTDPTTAITQIKMLNEDMMSEYDKGNYVIAGGDMNKDMLGDSSTYFGTENPGLNWTKPFPTDLLDSSISVVSSVDTANPIPSCRNCDVPYTPDTFVLTVDGFIVSDNVEISDCNVFDGQFKYSDHNPIYMDFTLK